MNRVTVETPHGTSMDFYHFHGLMFPKKKLDKLPSKDLQQHNKDMNSIEIREEDVYLASYEKSGTHWVFEILMMLRKGKAEYSVQPREHHLLQYRTPEELATVPSPRVLNSHFPVHFIQEGVLQKTIKVVHVQRNPKDLFVSLYHHVQANYGEFECESFSRFLPMTIGSYGVYLIYPWFKYVKEWEQFTKKNPDQILNLHYEDFKENPVREIEKINTFLQCGRSVELIEQIAKACSFQNMKKSASGIKDFSSVSNKTIDFCKLYRKGEVGDWKNWFTVADNEKMDTWLKENLVDTDLKFRYEL